MVCPAAGHLRLLRNGSGQRRSSRESGHAQDDHHLRGHFTRSGKRHRARGVQQAVADELATKLKNPAATAKTLHALGFAALKAYWNGTTVDKDRGLSLARRAAGNESPDQMVH